MPYAFNVAGASKADALAAAAAEFDTLELTQPERATDRGPALAAAEAVIAPFREPTGDEEIRLGINGDVSDYGYGLAALSVGVSVIIVPLDV